MKIVIVEDEARISRRIERMCRDIVGARLEKLVCCDSLAQAIEQIETLVPDLVLLDLNLNGQDGFELLQTVVASSFHTIIISANTDKAITAFAYGVLDFVPKPFTHQRLEQAFSRLSAQACNKPEHELTHLAIRKQGHLVLIDINRICYIKGAGIYTELYLDKGKKELHNKSLEKLEQLLPACYVRIHKSYIVSLAQAEKIIVHQGSSYQLQLHNGQLLPIGRSRYKQLRNKLPG